MLFQKRSQCSRPWQPPDVSDARVDVDLKPSQNPTRIPDNIHEHHPELGPEPDADVAQLAVGPVIASEPVYSAHPLIDAAPIPDEYPALKTWPAALSADTEREVAQA